MDRITDRPPSIPPSIHAHPHAHISKSIAVDNPSIEAECKWIKSELFFSKKKAPKNSSKMEWNRNSSLSFFHIYIFA